jgi:hypothetical protein
MMSNKKSNEDVCSKCGQRIRISAQWYADQISKKLGTNANPNFQSKAWVKEVYDRLGATTDKEKET